MLPKCLPGLVKAAVLAYSIGSMNQLAFIKEAEDIILPKGASLHLLIANGFQRQQKRLGMNPFVDDKGVLMDGIQHSRETIRAMAGWEFVVKKL